MPTNLDAYFRYLVIDSCLRDQSRIYHVEDILTQIEMNALDRKGVAKRLSRRQFFEDIKTMKNGMLDFHAPIEYSKDRGYYYSNPNFTIQKLFLHKSKRQKIFNAMMIIKQLASQNQMTSILNAILLLENNLRVEGIENRDPILYLEHSLNEPGQKWIDSMFTEIENQRALRITYAPFEDEPIVSTISPWLIKEYNNRWYVIGWSHDKHKITNLSLDRILELNASLQPYVPKGEFDHDAYYAHVFGITVYEDVKPVRVVFKANPLVSKYLITKPIHPSQKIELVETDGTTFSIFIIINYEIKHKLLSYGADITIVEPGSLRDDILEIAEKLLKHYRRIP